MRVLLVVWPAVAHLFPVVPLAWALRGAGHEVVVVSQGGLAGAVGSVGLTSVVLGEGVMGQARGATRPVPVGVGEELDGLEGVLGLGAGVGAGPVRGAGVGAGAGVGVGVGEGELWGMFRTFVLPAVWDFHPPDGGVGGVPPGIDDLVSFARYWGPDLVVWDPCFPSAAVAARVVGAAHARLLWGLDYWGWVTDRVNAAGGGVVNPLARVVGPLADRYGVGLDDELLLGQWTIDPVPAAMRLRTSVTGVPVRWTPFTGAGVLPSWLRRPGDRPRVALSLGTSVREFFRDGEKFIAAVLAGVADLDVEVVATLDRSQTEGITVPDNVRTVDYIPLTQLLPTCSAVIHHGGMGTFGAAAALRVPQLITDADLRIGVRHDDGTEAFFHAKHMDAGPTSGYVLSRGAGLVLDPVGDLPGELGRRVGRVLEEPAFREGAGRIHDELLATPSPADIVPLLERLSARHRSRG
ncbi:nucleotide disphospho-sugar-binding domain-containing protein [Streptomyces cyaneofuscatus]|uniref:nucleotide disphospho-sugar-binding domain-containing protein n=1 Tax=Streptomyces cyaneofuscatus TaxID=66883 RepID=UPI0037A4A2E1